MTTPFHELTSIILPTTLRAEGVVITTASVVLTVASVAPTVACPLCGTQTRRVHSRYRRTLRDLPWGTLSVRLVLRVRRFRCARRGCERRVFTERLPDLATPYARSTTRRREAQRALAFTAGGEAGARLAWRLRLAASPATLLRSLRATPALPPVLPRVIGVDDFARRRGQTYGTIVVDLERHRPLDLLGDRSAETLAAWLKQQPQLAVVCSDRSTEYARGIAAGAPHATAVADRWHLLVRRFTHGAILVTDEKGSEGDPWVNG